MVGVSALVITSILANIPLIMQFDYLPCTTFESGESGIRIEVAESACLPAYLWGYLSGFLLGINVLLPAIIQILMNAYIIKVLVQFKKHKTIAIGKLPTWLSQRTNPFCFLS